MARSALSRDELIDKLSAVFREHGYEGASLARLSEATGLVKASLYYQFPKGKEDMAAAVLAAMEGRIEETISGPLADVSLAPKERLRLLGEALTATYDGGRRFCVVDVLGIGEAGHIFRAHLGRMIDRLSRAITTVLKDAGIDAADAEQRAEDALIALQGSLVLARAKKDTGPFERVIAGMPARLLDLA